MSTYGKQGVMRRASQQGRVDNETRGNIIKIRMNESNFCKNLATSQMKTRLICRVLSTLILTAVFSQVKTLKKDFNSESTSLGAHEHIESSSSSEKSMKGRHFINKIYLNSIWALHTRIELQIMCVSSSYLQYFAEF